MRIAALDLGSNSFHLLVADAAADGTISPVVRDKEMLRLGDLVSRHGRIPEPDMDQAVATVRRFRLLAESAGADELHACATSATRTAANGDALVDRIRDEAGVKVRVISGAEEARLIFVALRASVVFEPSPALCIDIGGGSVEVVVGDAAGMKFATSLPIGVGRLSFEYTTSDPLAKRDRRRLHEHIARALEPIARDVARFDARLAVGSSGTVLALARLVASRDGASPPQNLNQFHVRREDLVEVHRALLDSDAAIRRKMPGMEPKRVDLIVAGSTLLTTALDVFGLDELVVSEWALREGIVLDAIGHHDQADWSNEPRAIRRASVQSLARRCNVDDPHSRQVARLALRLFDETAALHGLGGADRELLEYAALLHAVGRHVSSEGHHRHAAYIIRHAGLRGFSPTEVQVLAALARWQRRSDPKPNDDLVGELDDASLERIRRLEALMRVADGLDRSRTQVVEELRARTGPDLVVVEVDATGDAELDLWGARRKRTLFEKTFDRMVEFTAAHPAAALLDE